MTTHERARELAGAAYDGELDAGLRPELDVHLAGCESCRAFAARLELLSAAVASAPRLPAPVSLPALVRERIRPRRRRWTWALAPALAAAVAFVLVVVAAGPGGPGGNVFQLPAAGAAEPLLTLRTLYVEREVTSPFEPPVTERIWFQAPGYVRIERSTGELVVRRPDATYSSFDGARHATEPSIDLPEPLSPNVALLGTDTGPGPAVAGRATRRIEIDLGGERRTALVDAEHRSLLGSEQAVVLDKRGEGTVTKRVTRVEFDRAIEPDRFAIPAGPSTDAGFRETADLPLRPRALPRGFTLVRSGSGPGGAALLYAGGALPLLVTVRDASAPDRGPVRSQAVTVGGRPATLVLSLYQPPLVRFATAERVVTVSAPLPPDALVRTAELMFPAE